MNDLFYDTYCRLVNAGLLDPIASERHGLAVETKSRYWHVRNLWEAAGQPENVEAFLLQHKNDLPRVAGVAI
jgi:hypothetical protein